MLKGNAAFQRGADYATRRQELRAQRAFNQYQLRLKEVLLENALTARRTGTGPDDAHIARLMLDWQIIRDEVGGEIEEAA